MIAKAPIEPNGRCVVHRYGTAWALGTGLRVGLKPGEYRVTGAGDLNGVAALQLEGAYLCPAEICHEVRWQQADDRPAPSAVSVERV